MLYNIVDRIYIGHMPGDGDLALPDVGICMSILIVYSVTLWALVMLFPGLFAGIFTPNPTLLDFSAKALRIYCGGLFIFGIQIACQMTFVSLDKAVSSIIVAVMRKFVLFLPLIYLMPQLMNDKTMAVYTAEPVADVIAVTFTADLFNLFKKIPKKNGKQ